MLHIRHFKHDGLSTASYTSRILVSHMQRTDVHNRAGKRPDRDRRGLLIVLRSVACVLLEQPWIQDPLFWRHNG